MSVTTKDEQSEAVRQGHHRNAAGAWINGQTN